MPSELRGFSFLPLHIFLIIENLPINTIFKSAILKMFALLFVNCSCVINSPKFPNILTITQFFGSGIRICLAQWFMAAVTSKLNWEKIPSKLMHVAVYLSYSELENKFVKGSMTFWYVYLAGLLSLVIQLNTNLGFAVNAFCQFLIGWH